MWTICVGTPERSDLFHRLFTLETPMPLRYVTVPEFDNVLTPQQQAQLTDDNPVTAPASKNAAIIEYYLTMAESFAESYVGGRYGVPLVGTIPESFKFAVLLIAKYRLFLRRGMMKKDVEEDYLRTLTWLQQIKNGTVDLPIAVQDNREAADVTSGQSFTEGTFFHVPIF